MPIDLESLRSDLTAEREGADVPVLEWPGVTLRVRGASYAPYEAAIDAALARLKLAHGGNPPPDVWGVSLGQALADHILLGWDGLNVKYTPAVAAQCLTDPAYRDLRMAVLRAAAQVGKAQVRLVEEQEKN